MDNIDIKDPLLWKEAKHRAGFKLHFVVFCIAVGFLWLTWAFLGYIHKGEYGHKWPLYPMIGWFLALILHYLIVFKWRRKLTLKEYEKLIKNKNKI